MGFGDALAGAGSGAIGGSSLGPWGAIAGAGIGLFGSLFGAHEQASAASDAATITSAAQTKIAEMNAAAQKYAADLQAKASADALGFSKSGAENAFQNNEVSRAGNYDQWAAAQRRVGSVAKLLGFGDREIPTYRPGVDPNFTGSGGSPATSRPLPTIDPSAPIGPQVDAYFKAQGVPNTETPAWENYWTQWGANDPAYFAKRLAAADIFKNAPAPPVNPYAVSSLLT